MKRFLIATLALALATPAVALVSATTNSTGAVTDVRAADRAVVRYVVMNSQSEVALGRLALQKVQNDAGKAFAQRTIADHTTAMAQATDLARSQNLGSIDAEPTEEGIVELNHLSRYSGRDFDEV